MIYELTGTVALLSSTPAVLRALLGGLPGEAILRNEGGETMNARDVIAHLNHGERTDWLPRIRMILEFGGSKEFEPFDRTAYLRNAAGHSLARLLDEFAELRSSNLAAFDALHLTPRDLAREGRHPSFGVVTLSQLIATWAAHDMTHLHQLSRILAHPYREAVGPWNRFLGVMQCNGHSAQI